MQEKENKNESWNTVEHWLASEIIAGKEKVSKAKDIGIFCLTTAVIVISIGMAVINYKNDCNWRELFSSYDYVTQDGEGYNYYNSNVQGGVKNGTENTTTKEQEEIKRNGN